MLSKEIFEDLFEEHWSGLYAYAFNILKDGQSAEDCVQNVFVHLWDRRSEAKVLHPKAYLYQSVRFQCAKVISLKNRFSVVDLQEHIAAPVDELKEKRLKEKELLVFLQKHINALPQKCRVVFTSSKLDHKSNREIADELNISVSTVENHMNKALKILRNAVPDHLYLLYVMYFFNC